MATVISITEKTKLIFCEIVRAVLCVLVGATIAKFLSINDISSYIFLLIAALSSAVLALLTMTSRFWLLALPVALTLFSLHPKKYFESVRKDTDQDGLLNHLDSYDRAQLPGELQAKYIPCQDETLGNLLIKRVPGLSRDEQCSAWKTARQQDRKK